MPTPISSLVRQIKPVADKLNVLSFCFDEKHELLLTGTGSNVVAISVPGLWYKWNNEVMTKPTNYTMFEFNPNADLLTNLPCCFDYDIVVGYQRPSHYDAGKKVAEMLQVPFVMITNEFPVSVSDAFNISIYGDMAGYSNIYGNDSLKAFWNVRGDAKVIRPGVNIDKFKPTLPFEKRHGKLVTVANNFMQRDEETNFRKWKAIISGEEFFLSGHNPGLPSEFVSFSSLHKVYQDARIYLNTITGGVFPSEIIEAMASGCVVISLDFVGARDFIKHGENGFIFKTEQEAKKFASQINNDKALFDKISENARKFAVENCNLTTQSSMLKDELVRVVAANREKVYEKSKLVG